MSARYRPVSKGAPCPACGRPDWCAWTPDGRLKCERCAEPPAGYRRVKLAGAGAIFAPINADTNGSAPSGGRGGAGGQSPPSSKDIPGALNWDAESERFVTALTPERRDQLASQLGVTAASLLALGCGWAGIDDLRRMRASGAGWLENYPHGAFTFPERNGTGRIIGVSLRAEDGRKGSPSGGVGARRGLIVPPTLQNVTEVVLIVEGASDVLAALCLGLTAVGRPSATGGADQVDKLLHRRPVLVVGENDAKGTGGWAGRDGAERIAERLATEWEEEVPWTLPPSGFKDIRAWLVRRVEAGLDLNNAEACKAAGQDLLAELRAGASTAVPEAKPKQAELIVRLALEKYRIGLAEGDEPFAVPLEGPNIALMFRGSRDALRSTLSREYRRRYGSVPNASALADALTALSGEALECTPEPLHIRLARHEDSIVLDLGRADGAVVIITSSGWKVTEDSPVIFKRTALTAELPVPVEGGNLEDLRELLNVSDEAWDLLRGELVTSLIPEIPHPIVLWSGEQGTGKTTGAAFTVGLFDPSPAEVRSPPREPEQWAIVAAGSWGVVVDNVSNIPEWFSDALCKACTGDGWLRRRLYTDGDIAVLAFRRVVMLTSIDTGALKGDLGDRLVIIDLERIPDDKRIPEVALKKRYRELRPGILAGLLDLLVKVLKCLETLERTVLPRMADYAFVLMAMDKVLGTSALKTYLDQRDRIASEVVDDDAVGNAVVNFMEHRTEWRGSMKDLLRLLTPDVPPPNWPKRPRTLGGMLRRLAPALGRVGIELIAPSRTDKTRQYVLRKTARTARPPGGEQRPPLAPPDAGSKWDQDRAVDGAVGSDRPPDRPTDNPTGAAANGHLGRSGDMGGQEPSLSPSTPVAVCAACGQRKWWRILGEHGLWTCGACHPPAHGLLIECADSIDNNDADREIAP